MRVAVSLLLLFSLLLQGTTAFTTSAAAIGISGLAAVTGSRYTWQVKTATYPGGLNLKLGNYVGNLVISTNFTHTAAGTVGIVSGTITVTNPGIGDLQLTVVQAILQQPAAGGSPVRSIAECPRDKDGYVLVGGGKSLACPFAQLLFNSTSPVTVQAQAAIAGAGQLLGQPVTVLLSSTSDPNSNTSTAARALGACAVLSNTFMSGELFLTPGAVAAGTKLPSLGSAGAICSSTTSLYRVTFGPYSVGDIACGAYQVMNVARAHPLGGDQPPYMDSSVILVSITGCSAAAPSSPAPVAAPASSSNMRLPADSIIFGPQAASPPMSSAAPANPYNMGFSTGASSPISTGAITAAGTAYTTPASAPAPAAAAPPTNMAAALPAPTVATPSPSPAASSPSDEYYYTYEYEAQIPKTSTRRRRRRRLAWVTAASSNSSNLSTADDERQHSAVALATVSNQSFQQQQKHSEGGKDSQQQQQRHMEDLSSMTAVHNSHQQLHLHRRLQAAAASVQQGLDGLQLPTAEQGAASTRNQLQDHKRNMTTVQLAAATAAAGPVAQRPAATVVTEALPPSVQPEWLGPNEQLVGFGATPVERFGMGGDASGGLLGNSSSQGLPASIEVVGLVPDEALQRTPEWLLLQQPMGHPERQPGGSMSLVQQQQQVPRLQLAPPLQRFRAGRRQLLARQLQQGSSIVAPQFIAASTFYGPAAVKAADQPSIAFSAMQVGFGVMSYSWKADVSASPAAVRLELRQTSNLQYRVRVTRSELPRRTILRGSFVITNPLDSPLKLNEVSVEAPAAGKPAWAYVTASCGQGGTLASLLTTVMTVPGNGQVTCSFSASYPSTAPDNGVLFARAVTDAGRQLVSDGFVFTRPQIDIAADQALQLGACTVFSDTFLTAADSTAVLTPSNVPATGNKAPAAATAGASGSTWGVLLCSNITYAYTVKLGPYKELQCGTYKVLSQLRLHPLNGSSGPLSSATASVPVQLIGCAAMRSESAAFLLAAAAVTQDSAFDATQLAPPTLGLNPYPYRDVTTFAWSVTSAPTAANLRMQYPQTLPATFIVQYRKGAASPGRILSGTVAIQNPNLLDAVTLVEVQVELYQPSSTGPVRRAWAECPRDPTGLVVVPGQLLGGGVLTCSWSMQLLQSAIETSYSSSGGNAQLMAVAVSSNGLEIVSPPQPLSSIMKSDSSGSSSTDSCVAVSNTFQGTGFGGQVLLQPSSSGTGSNLLAGQKGGGRAADVVCNSLSVSYGVTYGPLSKYQCGVHRNTNLAVASPLTSFGHLTAAASTATVTVTGCPEALASLSLMGLQLQLVNSVLWNVTGKALGAAIPGPVRATMGQSIDIPIGLKYTAEAAGQQRQLMGTIQVSAIGSLPLVVAQVMVEVTPLDAATITAVPLLTWTAVCPRVGIMAQITIPSTHSISCSFAGNVPSNLQGYGSVLARVQLSDGSEAASPAVLFDFSQQPGQVISRNRCAIVSDHFLVGNGLLQPSKTTRPAAVSAPTQICSSQSVSFVASVGPFTREQCGQMIAVINLSRVSPVSATADQPPVSFATVVRLNVTGGCTMQLGGTP